MTNDPIQSMQNMINQVSPGWTQRAVFCQFCGKPILGLSGEFGDVKSASDPAMQQLEITKRAHSACMARSMEKKQQGISDIVNADITIFEKLPEAEKERLFEAGLDPFTKHGI